MNKLSKIMLISTVPLSMLLAGCDSSSTGSGSINLNVTDAPIDEAAEVVVAFSGVTLKPENGPAYDIDFVDGDGNPVVKTVDLMAQQGANSAPLLGDYKLDAGHYNWMRLKVIASKDTTDSYIVFDTGPMKPLYIPSGDENGLKLNKAFDITDGGAVNFTVDFDLRKSVVAPSNKTDAYKLRPTLRIVDNANIGHLTGNVGSTTLGHTDCRETDPDYAVYAFAGENITPDDFDEVDDGGAEPITTSLLTSTYDYTIGFLEPGAYTLAFTCEANLDVETNDTIRFIGTQNVTVTAGTTSTYDF